MLLTHIVVVMSCHVNFRYLHNVSETCVQYILGLGTYEDGQHPAVAYGYTLSPSPPATKHKRDSQSQTSVSVKVLRSISSSLLPPLLDGAYGEFTPDLFHDIVVAIQKISWKVEACLSFCSTVDTCMVHDEVFYDAILTGEMKDMMIASPPEEMKIQNSPAHLAVVSLKEDQILLDADMEAYWEKQRRRDNSIGDFISHGSGREGYFRPGRRTTVSISKRQVESLGLNVVDATAPDSLSPKRSNTTVGLAPNIIQLPQDSENFLSIRDRVLKKLAKEFPQFQADSEESEERVPKRPSTLPVNNNSQVQSVSENRCLSAPLPPINQGPIHHHTRLRERHSHEPPSTTQMEEINSVGSLGERTKSLEFDRVLETSTVPSPKAANLASSGSTPKSPSPKSNSNTMPTKRRETFVKLVKKKALSFGRADSRVRQRTPIPRNKSASEFFPPGDERNGSESPIEQFVLKAHPREASCTSSGEYKTT